MTEGNKRQAAIIFVIAGVFLVGALLVGLGIVKQQNKNVANNQGQQTNQPTQEKKATEEKQQKPETTTQTQTNPAPAPTSTQSEALANSVPAPQAVPATGPAALPATGPATNVAVGVTLIILAVFTAFRFLQSRQALQPKL